MYRHLFETHFSFFKFNPISSASSCKPGGSAILAMMISLA
jgi:hypothetical protein